MHDCSLWLQSFYIAVLTITVSFHMKMFKYTIFFSKERQVFETFVLGIMGGYLCKWQQFYMNDHICSVFSSYIS